MLRPVPRSKSVLSAVDIPGFFDAVDRALQVFMKTEPVPSGTKPQFVHAFPRERLTQEDDPFDIITFRVVQAGMAPTTNEGNIPRGIAAREDKEDTTQLGYRTRSYGWWEQVEVEFSIWSKSNLRADILTAWFHRFMMQYAFVYKYFQARGVQNFMFVSRADDEFDPSEGQEIYKRKLCYGFRLDNTMTLSDKTLESVTIEISVRHDGEVEQIELPKIPKQ